MVVVLIVLTATVYVQNKLYIFQKDYQSRIDVYVKSIRQWIKTGFKIVVIENSGYTFPEIERVANLEIITYNEMQLPECKHLLENTSKGASELFAINYALKKTLFKNFDFVIKVTGRYFIPGFEKYLNDFLTESFQVICQNEPNRCEFVGCSKHICFNFFDTSLRLNDGTYCHHIEHLYNERINKFDTIFICNKMFIEPTIHGGIEKVNYYL
jgi:hypothetical protein